MRKLVTILALVLVSGIASGFTIFEDDFSTAIDSADWSVKWDASSDQKDLFTAGNGYATLDTSVAVRSYHIDSKHAFSLTGSDTATITFDMRYVHEGDGNGSAANKTFITPQFNTTKEWWSGTMKSKGVVNRNEAIGMSHPVAPFVEGWITHSSLGVDTSAGSSQTSNWVVVQSTISVSGGTYWLDTDIYAADGTTFLKDGTAFDTGMAAGTTIYAGLSTDWHATTDTIKTITNIEEVHVDNFEVDVIPSDIDWVGGTAPNPSTWDAATANWTNGAVAGRFSDTDVVTFDDSSSYNNISISGTVQPGGITVNNVSKHYTFSDGIIGGTGDLTKQGAGTLTLNTANTYTGATDVQAGRLDIPGSITSAMTVNDGATLGGEGSSSADVTIGSSSGAILAVDGSTPEEFSTSATLDTDNGVSVLVESVPAAGGAFDIIGYGSLATTFDASDFSINGSGYQAGGRGAATFANSAGVITLDLGYENPTWQATGTGTWDINSSANWDSSDNVFFNGDSVIFDDTGSGTVTLGSDVAPSYISFENNSSTYTITGSQTLEAPDGITISGAGDVTIDSVIAGEGGLTKIRSGTSTGTLTLNGVNTYTGDTLLGNGTTVAGTSQAFGKGSVTLEDDSNANGTLALSDGVNVTNNLTVSSVGWSKYIEVEAGATSAEWSGDIVNNENNANSASWTQLRAGSGQELILSGSLSGEHFRLGSDGTVVLSGDNDLTSPTATNSWYMRNWGNKLRLASTNAAGGGLIDMSEHGTLQLADGVTTVGDESVVIRTVGAKEKIIEIADLNNGVAESATLAANILVEEDEAGNFDINVTDTLDTITLLGTITATNGAGMDLLGAGTKILLADNNIEDTVTISAGTLQLGNGGTVGGITNTGNTIVNNGTLAFNRSDSLTQGVHFASAAISGTGSLVKMGAGTLTLTADNTYEGNTTLAGGTIQVGDSGTSGSLGVGDVEVTVSGTEIVFNRSDLTAVTVDNRISGSGAANPHMRVTSGIVSFGGGADNSYANLTVEDGAVAELNKSGANSRVMGGQLNVHAGAIVRLTGTGGDQIYSGVKTTLDGTMVMNGLSEGIGSLSGASSAVVENNHLTPVTLTYGHNFAVSDFAGVIRDGAAGGSLGLAVVGNAIKKLSGSNSYSGTTAINGGTLLINGDQSGATGAVTVDSGATLGGSGTIGGAVSVDGTVSPGNSEGTLTVANDVTFNSGSTFLVEFDPGSDKLAVTGANTLALGNETATLSLPDLATATADLYIIATAEEITGRFSGHTADSFMLNGTYWIHYVRNPSGVDYIQINKSSTPTSSGVDVRAFQTAEGVMVEFVAYDVEADGSIMLALLDDEGNVLWQGTVNVTAGPEFFARFMVPGLELGGSYHFMVRDEVGKWWDAPGVTVQPFAAEMLSATLAGIEISFDSIAGHAYDVEYAATLGASWGVVETITADAPTTTITVEYPDADEPSGFFRVRMK